MNLTQLIEEIDPTLKKNDPSYKKLIKTVKFLEGREKVLFLTTSNRGGWAVKELNEEPKSTKLAKAIQSYLGKSKCTLIEVPDLKIYACEGNVSHMKGNDCGLMKASLKDKDKNPTGHHRCWRSINNPDDELWKISKELFESDAVLFFGSIRWGQMNAIYQNLIERLTWLENRHTTLGESNLLKDVSCGIIAVGQNWNGKDVVDTQKQVLSFFGFDVKDELSWNWQYTMNPKDETKDSYKKSGKDFMDTFELS
jgi:multimeric flavodoxin WrbA